MTLPLGGINFGPACSCADHRPASIKFESDHDSYEIDLRAREHLGDELAVVDDYEGILAEVVKAAKEKGVRFSVADFKDGEVESLNQHVVIFRGAAAKLIHRIFEGSK